MRMMGEWEICVYVQNENNESHTHIDLHRQKRRC